MANLSLQEGGAEATQMAEESIWPEYRQIVEAIVLIGTGQDSSQGYLSRLLQ